MASILGGISDNPGAYKKKIRRGRGPNNKGRTAGRGASGQKARGRVPAGFSGGQKTVEEVQGKRGFENEYVNE
jgi:large subunit ribosomal protein L15